MKYIDIHSHLNLSPLKEQKDAVIKKMRELEVGAITVGTDYETSKLAVEIAEQNENIWATVGIHPTEQGSFDYEKYKTLATNKKVVAIGECGLDYFHPGDKEKQKEIFIKQIELAQELKLPLMIHCRNAYDDLYEIVKNKNLKANIHFFQGSIDIAKKFLELGFTFSFDGPITFARDYDEVIKFLPIESIMAETDAPFAAPAPYRGQTNEPSYVIEIVKKIAEIKNLPEEEVREILLNNSKKTFDI